MPVVAVMGPRQNLSERTRAFKFFLFFFFYTGREALKHNNYTLPRTRANAKARWKKPDHLVGNAPEDNPRDDLVILG